MPEENNSTAAAIYSRDSLDATILVADGYGIALTVNRGHLTIHDGIGKTRRERRIPKAQRDIRRIVILGHTGHITLDAIRFCADTGITLTQVDADGKVLLHAGIPGRNDPRLRRAQAAAPNASVGLEIARALLGAKLTGQAAVAEQFLDNRGVADQITAWASALLTAKGLRECRELESLASNVYFGAWAATARCHFAARDAAKIPDHWTYFAVRRSPIAAGKSSSVAADPINALLNYSYALAEAECLTAIRAVGLDPGLGIVHTDSKNRDSLALDLLEPLRPLAERHVLRLLQRRHFLAANFHETRQGACRLLPPLTHELADAIPSYATAVAPLAEQVAHAIAKTSPGKITLTTPLTRANFTAAQRKGKRALARQPEGETKIRRTCAMCGTDLYGSARKYCPTCWPVARNEISRQAGIARRKPVVAKPTAEGLSGGISFERYQTEILPALANVKLMAIERATGMSNANASRVRRGLQVPNPRHWAVLAHLIADRTQ